MLSLIPRLAALTMIMSILSALLPAGSLRRTALMAAGLFVALCYLEGLQAAFSLPEKTLLPTSALTASGVDAPDLSSALEVWARQGLLPPEAR